MSRKSGKSAATPFRLVGTAGSVVPNGVFERQFRAAAQLPGVVPAVTGIVKGSCVVTLNGPLIPRPALVDNSVKYSPRSA